MEEITKDIVQQKSLELSADYDNILLKWATGVGKSLAFIKMQEMLGPKKVYIIVAETAHIENWKQDYIKHNKQELLAHVEIFCYASLKKYANTEADLICLDEGHHIVTDIRLSHLSSIICPKIILLSATIKSYMLQTLEKTLDKKFKEYEISLNDAITNDILPAPTIYLVPLSLPTTLDTIEFVRGKKEKRKIVTCTYANMWQYKKDKKNYPDLHLIIQCTYLQKSLYLDNLINYYKSRYFAAHQEFMKNKWMYAGGERKRFLAEAKTNQVKLLLSKIQNKRFLCFAGSINQANILSKNKNVIHSKIKNSLSIIEQFNNKVINHLFVVDMLKEGQNLNNIEAGIIVQLDGDSGPFIQKAGRVMRAEHPVIFIFYYKNTRDTEYLDNILKEIDPKYIKTIYNLNDFKLD